MAYKTRHCGASWARVSSLAGLLSGIAGTYAGYDRLGRIKEPFWDGYNSTPDVDRLTYTYDYAGNRTSRDLHASIYATNNQDQTYAV